MFNTALRQSFGIAARASGQALLPKCSATMAVQRATASASRALLRPHVRPLAAFQSPWSQMGAVSKPRMFSAGIEQPTSEKMSTIAEAPILASGNVVQQTKNTSLVFDLGLSVVVVHYQHIIIGTVRCLFQAWRPLLILFGFSQLIKAVFFIAGAPIWFSFYSIWMFEVFYGLMQCGLSFLFIAFFYNNLSFARIRPALQQMFKQQRESVARAARLAGC
eukprot:TRINITY_DN4641_c0_g1_i1.p1 TRINITY_DN4641_c0_g1~~TRINITY_DN4641_c0_g1_i1.p1  ORF type:complete len:219 (-),score=37.67 TRINITY_DN4641_c0_g1_i1:64-720(-)